MSPTYCCIFRLNWFDYFQCICLCVFIVIMKCTQCSAAPSSRSSISHLTNVNSILNNAPICCIKLISLNLAVHVWKGDDLFPAHFYIKCLLCQTTHRCYLMLKHFCVVLILPSLLVSPTSLVNSQMMSNLRIQ